MISISMAVGLTSATGAMHVHAKVALRHVTSLGKMAMEMSFEIPARDTM
jgi:hypothetical protein